MTMPRDSRRGFITRRDALRRMGVAGLALSGSGALLAACGDVEGTDETTTTAARTTAVSHPKAEIGTLRFSNWPLYIDKDVLPDWERQQGAQVRYIEDINDNEEFFAKVRQELEAGQPIERDLAVLTDWMAQRWIDSDYVEPIDRRNVPNARNLLATLASPPYDPKRAYTLPWQSGMTAIGYDPKRTGRTLGSVADLFDPKFKGRVTMLLEWRDTLGLVLLGEGKEPAKATKDDLLAAIEKVDQANADGQIRRFTGNDYAKDLASGNVWVTTAWSGDVVQLQADNPGLEFLIPEEGAMIWSDNMLIPKGASSPYGAETMMNFAYDPEVAARIAAEVNYVTPVKGAKEVLDKTDPELAANELIFPSDATLAKLHSHTSLSAADDREVTAAWQKVTGA